jgi:hypothetical protein
MIYKLLAFLSGCLNIRAIIRLPLTVFMGAIDGTGAYPSMIDVVSTLDPQGNTAAIVELLQQKNPILLDMPWVEGNTNLGHQVNVRTGLPAATWTSWYQGVPATKSTYARVMEACAMLEQRTEIDKRAADFNGNSATFRLKEMLGSIEALNQGLSTALFYGDSTVNPQQFNGLTPRFNSLSAGNGGNIIDAGGTGANLTSIWFIGWSGMTVHGIFPKGQKGGLQREDLGTFDAFDASRNRFRAVGDLLQWNVGMAVEDWRYIVRIANIDMDKLKSGQGAADLIALMLTALHLPPEVGEVRSGLSPSTANGAAPTLMMPNPVFYCTRKVAAILDLQTQVKSNFTLKSGSDVYGRPVTSCRGVPIRSCDALLETESRVI